MKPGSTAGGVRGDSPVAQVAPSARGRAAGGSRGRLMQGCEQLPKKAKKTATVTQSLHMGGVGREEKGCTIVHGITTTTNHVLLCMLHVASKITILYPSLVFDVFEEFKQARDAGA